MYDKIYFLFISLTTIIVFLFADIAAADDLSLTVVNIDRGNRTVTVKIAYSLTSRETNVILLMGWRKDRNGEHGISLAREPVAKGQGVITITANYRVKNADWYGRTLNFDRRFTGAWEKMD